MRAGDSPQLAVITWGFDKQETPGRADPLRAWGTYQGLAQARSTSFATS